jgi:5-methylcytosine-specific restriction protein B
MPKSDSLQLLADIIRGGLSSAPKDRESTRAALAALFGDRYQQRHAEPTMLRDAYTLANDAEEGGVPYAGLINPDNPPSGPYGGTSLVWFPIEERSLIGFGVGTRGLSPDEGILSRPGHRRRIAALRRLLGRMGVEAWTKADPAALGEQVPKAARDRFPGFEKVFQRYGREMYCNAVVPKDSEAARNVVRAFLDLYAYERGWQVLKAHENESNELLSSLRADLFITPSAQDVHDLLRARRFVVLQGPPGTGKTRLADEVRRRHFDNRGMTVQFHPAVTYEDFVVGLYPDAEAGSLSFKVRLGWLVDAALEAEKSSSPYLLLIDEINRADLGKVLGEAIYLFEAGEVGGANARSIRLKHPVAGRAELRIPENLYVLGTMNTADRSIASLDLAVRRRFAFATLPPSREVVAAQELPLATSIFDRLVDVFVEHAPDEALHLLPGHAYFLANDEGQLVRRFRHELLPLLDEYLRQGLLGPASNELQAVRDAVEDTSRQGYASQG